MTELALSLYLNYLRDVQTAIEAYQWLAWHYGWAE